MFDSALHFSERLAEFERDNARLRRGGQVGSPIVFLGDSLVETCGKLLPWANRGIASDHLTAADNDVFDRLGPERLHPRPRAIVVLLGINDLTVAPEAVERHALRYAALLARLRESYPTAALAAVSVLPTCGPLDHLKHAIRHFNVTIAAAAKAHEAQFWDLHPVFAQRDGSARRLYFRPDGVHLNRLGNLRLAEWLLRQARKLPGVTQQAPFALPPQKRSRLAEHLLHAFGAEAWADRAGSKQEVIETFLEPEIDFFCRYLATGHEAFRDLYIGSRARFFAKNAERLGLDAPRTLLERDAALWAQALSELGTSPAQREAVALAFNGLRDAVSAHGARRLRLLFVGDCLMEDLELLVGGRLLRHGLLADVDTVVSKNPLEQMRALGQLRGTRYDAVVYSPFTWEFDQEFRNFVEPSRQRPRDARAQLEAIWARVEQRVRLLADTHDCLVYVHNASATVRAASPLKRAVKVLATRNRRALARRELGERIAKLVDEVNKSTFPHVVVMDEAALSHGLRDELSLGRFVYYAGAIHPAELSVALAEQLTYNLTAGALLREKKVVVCDLDNTLWEGVIGEGLGISHYRVRQRTLNALKLRGVVLAIASKNDPQNVSFDGGVLKRDDFVAAEISWAPKVISMRKLQDYLNLKLKDFVFLDDRADERELCVREFPQLTAYDPCSDETWRLFAAWAALPAVEESGDRTKLYAERAQREQALATTADAAMARDMFMKLGLTLDLHRALPSELARVYELINRTNQWNLRGTRCTFNEVRAWAESDRHLVYAARVRDKFGDMGIVSVCVAEVRDSGLDVLAFVLSCRVFGYGVETRMLDQLMAEAQRRYGRPAVTGQIVMSPHNKPCRDFFFEHGFTQQDDVWHYSGGERRTQDPVWFS